MARSCIVRPRDLLAAVLVAALVAVPLVGTAAGASAATSSRALYTTTNADGPNALVVYDRDDGHLTEVARLPTGGLGTGAGLGSQGAVIVHRRWLFAVNGGSDSVSSFSLRGRLPALVDTAASGGQGPVSVTAHRDLLYVLNADGAGSISGFRIGLRGDLAPLPGSTRPLSGAAETAAAQVSFTADGDHLVVSERATNRITTYAVGDDGRPSDPVVAQSEGMTPFGFDVDRRGRLFVSEAFGGAEGASAVSSYGLSSTLSTISPSVPTTETAACWVEVTRDGRHLYTTNTGSGSVTGYRIAADGSLSRLDADGVTADTGQGSAPTDLALTRDGRVLHVLHSGTGAIGAYGVGIDGSLTPLGAPTGGVPASAAGLASS